MYNNDQRLMRIADIRQYLNLIAYFLTVRRNAGTQATLLLLLFFLTINVAVKNMNTPAAVKTIT